MKYDQNRFFRGDSVEPSAVYHPLFAVQANTEVVPDGNQATHTV